jgi:hypothetical protein
VKVLIKIHPNENKFITQLEAEDISFDHDATNAAIIIYVATANRKIKY